MTTHNPDTAPHVQALLDALPWQAAVVDLEGVIQWTNRPWRDVASDPPPFRDDIGTNYLDVCASAPEEDREASEAAEAIQAVLSGQAAKRELEYPCHSPDAPHWFLMTVSPIIDGGRRVGALVTHQEITARRESEHDLRAFVAHAAHDLRSPLRHLASFPELLEADLGPTLEDPQRRWLSTIRRAAVHMRSQLDNLLALARSRLHPLRFAPVDTRALVRERLELQREMLHADAALDVSNADPVVTDEKLLTVLVDNVITNVLKHGRGTEGLTLRVTAGSRENRLVLHFDDNGPGFGNIDEGRLVRPFERGPARTSGMGLGLSIVKQVAQRLGGSLGLGRSPLGGARVTVELPVRREGDQTDRVDPDAVELRRFGGET